MQPIVIGQLFRQLDQRAGRRLGAELPERAPRMEGRPDPRAALAGLVQRVVVTHADEFGNIALREPERKVIGPGDTEAGAFALAVGQ